MSGSIDQVTGDPTDMAPDNPLLQNRQFTSRTLHSAYGTDHPVDRLLGKVRRYSALAQIAKGRPAQPTMPEF